MILELAATLELDLSRSWMIGDAASDMKAGRAAGCRTALIADAAPAGTPAELTAASLLEAAQAIVRAEGDAGLSPA